MVAAFLDKGWARFEADPALIDWSSAARSAADAQISDPDQQAAWLRCEGTWFVGVDALPNDEQGRVNGSGPLSGAGVEAMQALYGTLPLHPGQVSVIYPGYPRPRDGEGEAAFRYRLRRDGAHVDGLLAVGPDRARMLKERHAYILGLPLSHANAQASPLVVWEGSHHIMRRAFEAVFKGTPAQDWGGVDVTKAYQSARREVFETCQRVVIPAAVGEVTLVHRLTLHGMAPWGVGAKAGPEGRMIAYFRPEFPGRDDSSWLTAP